MGTLCEATERSDHLPCLCSPLVDLHLVQNHGPMVAADDVHTILANSGDLPRRPCVRGCEWMRAPNLQHLPLQIREGGGIGIRLSTNEVVDVPVRPAPVDASIRR